MKQKKEVIKQWQKWNEQGFIPGPNESEIDFLNRIDFCQNLQSNLTQTIGTYFPFAIIDQQSKEILEEALALTQTLYGIRPQWVPLFFNNYQLAPWHGGCAWIFQLNDQTPTSAFLQLRSVFRRSPSFLGIYQRHELIAHELAHVGRMLYQEPQFEEVLAYQSSPYLWRKWLGPIIQSSKESLFFISLLGLTIIIDIALLFLGMNLSTLTTWIKFLPILPIILGLSRLAFRHQTFKRCLHNLEALYPSSEARHLLYRLRDSEIQQFSRFSPLNIQEFIEEAVNHSFRWNFLKTIYPPFFNPH